MSIKEAQNAGVISLPHLWQHISVIKSRKQASKKAAPIEIRKYDVRQYWLNIPKTPDSSSLSFGKSILTRTPYRT